MTRVRSAREAVVSVHGKDLVARLDAEATRFAKPFVDGSWSRGSEEGIPEDLAEILSGLTGGRLWQLAPVVNQSRHAGFMLRRGDRSRHMLLLVSNLTGFNVLMRDAWAEPVRERAQVAHHLSWMYFEAHSDVYHSVVRRQLPHWNSSISAMALWWSLVCMMAGGEIPQQALLRRLLDIVHEGYHIPGQYQWGWENALVLCAD